MSEIVRFRPLEESLDAIRAVYADLERELSLLVPFASIQHIGSTSVPGSITKGDLDIGVSVAAASFEEAVALLEARCTRHEASHSSDHYQPFVRACGDQDVGIQLFVAGSIYEARFVAWRDALRRDPELLARYNALKQEHDGKSMSQYRAEKSRFIRGYLEGDP